MMTQSLAPAPTKDPLTTRDRQIIATIVNQSDYSKNCQPEDVVTIWITEDGTTVWVKMTHGYARYHKEQFKRAVAEVKASLSAPVKCNHKGFWAYSSRLETLMSYGKTTPRLTIGAVAMEYGTGV